MIFGSKEIFAIEIAPTKKEKIFRLCLWICNERYGNFQKTAILDYSIKGFNKFINLRHELYEDKFNGMSVKEILDDIADIESIIGTKPRTESISKRFEKYIFFIGDQLTNQYGALKLLYKNNEVIFLTFRGFLKPMRYDKYIVDYDYFVPVVNNYIDYVKQEAFI